MYELQKPDTSATLRDVQTIQTLVTEDFDEAVVTASHWPVQSTGIAHIAIRVNATFNCTGIPPKYPKATKVYAIPPARLPVV